MERSTNEWELSKENIQPIQQGRKPNVLKAALAAQPEDLISQQRQNFEQELRTYSGEDPLSVWCRYIKWVEQNFPKGGKEGHIEKLIQQCLSVLRNETKYYDDQRFVDVWLKFANTSTKPIEVYNYMYSHNIAHKSSKFFIAWAWELEQLSNWKRADEVLSEGIYRNAEPVGKLKSAQLEFENRMAVHVMNADQKHDTGEKRSAFSILNPLKKHKEAPISRIGENVMHPSKESMTLGHRQPQPKSTINSKVPFKIYSSDNVAASSLPVQSENSTPYVLHSDAAKENEKTASKWNKIRLTKSSALPDPKTPKNPGFALHCDEGPQPVATPRSGSKMSSILSSRKKPLSPPMALFEPHDPMKRPMYEKNKVYGGTEEYSLEEIRAAKWFEKQKKLEEERKKMDEQEALKNKIKFLEEQLQQMQFQSNLKMCESDPTPVKQIQCTTSPRHVMDSNVQKEVIYVHSAQKSISKSFVHSLTLPEEVRNVNVQEENKAPILILQKSKLDSSKQSSVLPQKVSTLSISEENDFSTSSSNKQSPYSSIKKQETTLSSQTRIQDYQTSNDENQVPSTNGASKCKKNLHSLQNMMTSMYENFDALPQKCNSTSYSEAANMVQELYNGTFTSLKEDVRHFDFSGQKEEHQTNDDIFSLKKQKGGLFSDLQSLDKLRYDQQELEKEDGSVPEEPKKDMPFSFYHDPTDVIQNKRGSDAEVPKKNVPFSFYHDPTIVIPNHSLRNKKPTSQDTKPNVGSTTCEMQALENKPEINSCTSSNEATRENLENVPPDDYVQESAKRELAGYLVPSKNIPFIPLEEQEECEDVYDEEDYIQNPGQATLDENTVNYTRQFATAQFLASTPCASRQISLTSDQEKPANPEPQCVLMPPPSKTPLQAKKNDDIPILVMCENVQQKEVDRISLHDFKLKYGSNHISPAVPASRLSIIMESSGECYSKSSSSSCSSSACSTKLGFSHSSHQHSTSHKQISKTDTLTEIDGPGTKISNTHCGKNSSTLKEQSASQNENRQSQLPTSSFQLYSLDISPFEQEFTLQLLDTLPDPISNHKHLYSSKGSIANIKIGTNLNVGGQLYTIEKLKAEGAYAKVYVAKISSNSFAKFELGFEYQNVAIKVCKNANEWEFYICLELQKRLNTLNNPPNISLSVMKVTSAVMYYNGIALVTEYSNRGTLLDILNIYKKRGSFVPEYIAMYFTLEMLQIVSIMHECSIVHADIKPDNFLLTKYAFENVDSILENLHEKTTSLRLIDFGRAIDLKFFKAGVCFNTVVETDDFKCNEMKENKRWVYEPDWYGVLGCIHVLLFSEYMKVKKNSDGFWEPVQKFKRYWFVDLWQPLFHSLMNIPLCYEEPDVKPFIDLIAIKLRENAPSFMTQVAQLDNLC